MNTYIELNGIGKYYFDDFEFGGEKCSLNADKFYQDYLKWVDDFNLEDLSCYKCGCRADEIEKMSYFMFVCLQNQKFITSSNNRSYFKKLREFVLCSPKQSHELDFEYDLESAVRILRDIEGWDKAICLMKK